MTDYEVLFEERQRIKRFVNLNIPLMSHDVLEAAVAYREALARQMSAIYERDDVNLNDYP